MYCRASRRNRSVRAERPVPFPSAFTASRQLLSAADFRMRETVEEMRPGVQRSSFRKQSPDLIVGVVTALP